MSDPVEFPDWFAQTAKKNFEEFLLPLAGKPDLAFLQIGVFTGNASAWMLENVLTDESSCLHDVDTWQGSEDLRDIDFAAIEARYDEHVAQHGARVIKHKMSSTAYLSTVAVSELFDFIYIDGDHTAFGTMSDAVRSWPLLKVGGIVAFDDFTWRSELGPAHSPMIAIEAFGACLEGRIEALVVNAQAWGRKLS